MKTESHLRVAIGSFDWRLERKQWTYCCEWEGVCNSVVCFLEAVGDGGACYKS